MSEPGCGVPGGGGGGVYIIRIILKENDEAVSVKETQNGKYRYKNTGNTIS